MRFSRRHFLLLLLSGALSASTAVAATRAKPTRPAAEEDLTTGYKGAIVLDAATGKTLWEHNADVVSPPASMTKLMTFAVLHDKLASGAIALDTMVRITKEDSAMGGTEVYLDPRETFSVEELIYAAMIQSANDAAHALARAAGGSVPAFVQLMNDKARELGMTHTKFRSPHGLPPGSRRLEDGDLTTPRDFALLSRYLLLKTNVLKYSSVRERDFGPERAQGPQHMVNHNKLLGKVAGVDGLKTGYTAGAGYCLAATAQRKDRRVIVVIMGSFGPAGHEIDKGHARDLKSIELLEHGFATLPPGGPAFVSDYSAATTTSGTAAMADQSMPQMKPAAPPAAPANKENATVDGAPAIKFTPPRTKK